MEDQDKQSRFNAGVALTERIDAMQRAINAARFNPLQVNMETGTYNYEVMISANDALLKEAWSKLSKDERLLGERLQKAIVSFLENFPPIMKMNSGEIKVNIENYKKLMLLIDYFEKKNKEFLDNHNLNAPNSDDDEGL